MDKLDASLFLPFMLSIAQCAPDHAPDHALGSLPVSADEEPARAPARDPDDVGAPAVRVPIDGLPSFGDPRAPVTIVAFVDHECPYCAKAEARISALRSEYGDRVRLVVASHPLPMHEHAEAAARAFLAATELGKGDEMSARLFADQNALDDEGLVRAASALAIDGASFEAARRSPRIEAQLRLAEKLGEELGVDGTPTYFVNGRRLLGARPAEAFRALVDEELGKARALALRGTPPEKIYDTIMASAPPPSPAKARAGLADEIVEVTVDDAPIRGAAHAPVTVVFFGDFECPFSIRAEKTLREIDAAHPGKLRVAFRHRPLPMHTHARLAAQAAVAADRQGRFWEYHDVLVSHRDARNRRANEASAELDRDALERYAFEAGLDILRFDGELDHTSTIARVAADEKRAAALDVKGTPTAFVNGRRIVGAQPIATWLALIERSLSRK